MTATSRIPEAVRKAQLDASDPDVSAWVSANAGSGKTHVLAQRVIRLLLEGEDPARILCITFTKAAAANMATRVFDTLAGWTALDDSALDQSIREVGGRPNAEIRARARRLFALALETPGGLKVQTIHAFCTRLLHQFPFEADVAARFTVLDEVTERQLLEELSLDVMLEGAGDPASPLGRALETAIGSGADQTLRDVFREAIGERDRIETWIENAGSIDNAAGQLANALQLNPADTIEAVEDEFFSQSLILASDWQTLVAALAEGQKSDKDHVGRLATVGKSTGSDRVEAYLDIFCTDGRTPRQSIVTNAIRNKHPEWADRLQCEQIRVCALLDRHRAVICRDRTRALLTIAHAVIRRYRAEKARRGLLDYDDLIDHALALFRKTSAAWVLYKLDLGIDHVLIDEAQDTSPRQWAIIEVLTGEFRAGAGARPRKRTIFAVGDEKQSIFSFQGAAPHLFSEKRVAFERAIKAAELPWRTVELRTSFRSGPTVLRAVDAVFAQEQAYRGLSADPVPTVHEALPGMAPGLVEIWPLTPPAENRKLEGWDLPFDTMSEESPSIRLARRIAENVALWMKAGTRPGDILILVRQRGVLFESIIRALKQREIAVAGADRLLLTEHIAVMDLIALADALLLPEDDLALATVLKSPLFGFDEDDLFRIAHGRGKVSLRASLFGKAAGESLFAGTVHEIARLTDAARRESPFTFYARLLGAHGGRRKFLARLGTETNDALDEFLNLALVYESRETPSLQGFIAWLREAQAEVKRDMEMARNEVRVMTVHGAKGLEAHTVVIADTTTPPAGYYPPRLLELANGMIWVTARVHDSPGMSAARQQALNAVQEEHKRLLYVALTRAKARLVVCGTAVANKKNGKPEGCWYSLIESALLPHSEEADAADGEKIRVYQGSVAATPPADEVIRRPAAAPAWLTLQATPEPVGPVFITPSDTLDEEWIAASGTAGADPETALARGRLMHRLMQSLPDIAPDRRADTARDYLARTAFTEHERADIATGVLAILADPRFAALFAPGSRAEVPIVGRLTRDGLAPLAVSGQVDRLVVMPDSVLIADYKTNQAAPRRLEDAITSYPGYVRQLALYRALLARIYPGRAVRAALVWTAIPNLMEFPAHALDAALAPHTSA